MRAPRKDYKLSVVMPVHNASPFLDAAIRSILAQGLTDFEFVIYDDASVDGSAEKLAEWAGRDERIRLYTGSHNLGPAGSSNEVVVRATSPVIARMDADDISMPDRLERQYEVLTASPDVGIVASLCDVINSKGGRIRGPELWRLARKSWLSPFPHGSMMFRRDLFDAIGGYDPECEFWEDLDFVVRASEQTRVLVIPRPLYLYRQSTSSTRIASSRCRVENALDLRYRAVSALGRGGDYGAVLTAGRCSNDARVDPRVFLSLGLLALWSDQRPSFVRRFLSRARVQLNAGTMIAIIWLSVARLSPRTARTIMNLRSYARNTAIKWSMSIDKPVEWRVPGRVRPFRRAKGVVAADASSAGVAPRRTARHGS